MSENWDNTINNTNDRFLNGKRNRQPHYQHEERNKSI